MKSARSSFDENHYSDSLLTQEKSSNIPDTSVVSGTYYRSYNALNAALISIFEAIYLPQEVSEQHTPEGKALSQSAAARLLKLTRDQFHIFGDHDEKGLLSLRVRPVIADTQLIDISKNSKIVRNAITNFFTELNEFGAGIHGVDIDPVHHRIMISSPRGYLALIESVCREKNIATAEQAHTAYALRDGDPDEKRDTKPGHYSYLPEPKKPKIKDEAQHSGELFRRWAGHKSKAGDLAKPLFNSLAVHAYGYRELGHLINEYEEKGVYPLLSLLTLQATVEQDVGRTPVLKELSAFNLH